MSDQPPIVRTGTVLRFTKKDGAISGVILAERPNEYLNTGRDRETRQYKSWLVDKLQPGQRVQINCREWQGALYVNDWQALDDPAAATDATDTYHELFEDDEPAPLPSPPPSVAPATPLARALAARDADGSRVPLELRLRLLKLALSYQDLAFRMTLDTGQVTPPSAEQIVETAQRFEAYLTGTALPPSGPSSATP